MNVGRPRANLRWKQRVGLHPSVAPGFRSGRGWPEVRIVAGKGGVEGRRDYPPDRPPDQPDSFVMDSPGFQRSSRFRAASWQDVPSKWPGVNPRGALRGPAIEPALFPDP